DGDGEADGVGLAVPPGTTGCRGLSGPITISVPTTTTAISAAASPATQTGPRRSRPSTRLDRTRSDRSELGDPLMRSNASFSSRRKLSFDKSEHLLERKVGAQPPGGAID